MRWRPWGSMRSLSDPALKGLKSSMLWGVRSAAAPWMGALRNKEASCWKKQKTQKKQKLKKGAFQWMRLNGSTEGKIEAFFFKSFLLLRALSLFFLCFLAYFCVFSIIFIWFYMFFCNIYSILHVLFFLCSLMSFYVFLHVFLVFL